MVLRSEIQNECNAIINKKGDRSNGEAEITSSCRLKEKQGILYVVHVVGPVWNGGHYNEPLELSLCVVNALTQYTGKIRSISFPAVSSGIFGFPKALCADIMIKSAIRALDMLGPGTFDEIRFCNFDKPTVDVFKDAFDNIQKKHYNSQSQSFNFPALFPCQQLSLIFFMRFLKKGWNSKKEQKPKI